MIASWMLYAVLISVLVTLAALAAERAFTARGWPTRVVWAAAIALSLAWPIGAAVARLIPERRPVTVMPFTIVVQAPISTSADEYAGLDRARMLDRTLAGLWIAMSLLLFTRLVQGVMAIERSRMSWRTGYVDGMRVRFSDNVGPAVVGLRAMDVVLPEWILSLDKSLRALVLQHEDEHRRAGDPHLLFAAAITVALMPWNAALWFQVRRLRLAVEVDCDARVLHVYPSPERYGMLILAIAQRRTLAPGLFAPMMSEPATNLERRILAMRSGTRRLVRVTAYGGGAVAVALLAFASSLQSAGTSFRTAIDPVRIPSIVAQTARASGSGKLRVATLAPAVTSARQVVALPRIPVDTPPAGELREGQVKSPVPRYPDALRSAGIEGAVLIRVATDMNGRGDPASALVLRSTHELFASAVRAIVGSWQGPANTITDLSYIFVMADQTGANLDALGPQPPNSVLIVGAPVQKTAATPQTGVREKPVEQPAYDVPAVARPAYFEFQVDRQAAARPGSAAPRYPDMLRSANVEGEVLAQFVVNADGTPDMSTFKVLRSTHDLFTNAVRENLEAMQFYPGVVRGNPVRQLIQMPFMFSLSKPK